MAPSFAAGDAAGPTAFPFPVSESHYWLSQNSGAANGTSGQVLLLTTVPPTGSSPANQPMIPILSQLPLGLQPPAISWYSTTGWDATRGIAASPRVELYFFVNVEAITEITVELHDVAPSGLTTLLGEQTQTVSLQNLVPYHDTWLLRTTGASLGRGHTLGLTVTASDLDVLTWLQYGSTSAAADLQLPQHVQDTDLDGIPDDVDACPTAGDCDNNSVIDGRQTAYYNSTAAPVSYYQSYYNYPATSGTPGQPGQPGLPGEPGTPGNPFPQPGTPGGPDTSVARRSNLELGAGIAMGCGSLLVTLGGLFGRHPL
ncbi:MAG: hypothetical protein V4510_00815 [bacterium]